MSIHSQNDELNNYRFYENMSNDNNCTLCDMNEIGDKRHLFQCRKQLIKSAMYSASQS